jgi:DNA recombination protein RmuC
MLPAVALLAGLALGASIAWFIAGFRAASDNARVKSALDAALRDKESAESARAVLQSELDAIEEAKRSMKETFDSLAAKALHENNRNFLAMAQLELGRQQSFATSNLDYRERAIANLLTPILAKFDEFQQKVASLERDGIEGRAELKAQIENLRSLNERLRWATSEVPDPATEKRPVAQQLSA